MKIYILTSSLYKEKELSRYFQNVGLKTHHMTTLREIDKQSLLDPKDSMALIVSEQTRLVKKETGKESSLLDFEEVVHFSTVSAMHLTYENGKVKKHIKKYKSSVSGLIFPNLKTQRQDVYDWDEIFVSEKSMLSYQEMKDKDIKNSARDLAFSKFIDDMDDLFKFSEKVNLNFNKSSEDAVISFEPFVENLLKNNPYYKVCNNNLFFKTLLENTIAQGLFVRRAEDRSQRNYWLPGLNAGIPLTPKKDDLHEATFMFHDIMHFIFPDIVVTDHSLPSKNKYIISRMMSEAFTIILADMFFVSLLKDAGFQYDFAKRKIYPLFEKIKFSIDINNQSEIKKLLWANTCFALLGEEGELRSLVKDERLVNEYKEKYQRFFQEDYRWTLRNYENVVKSADTNAQWYDMLKEEFPGLIISAKEYLPDFDHSSPLKQQVCAVFENMFEKLMTFANKTEKDYENKGLNNAVKRYMSGQLNIFYQYDTIYNKLFLKQINTMLKQGISDKTDIENIRKVYSLYLNKLHENDMITAYDQQRFVNIFPVFKPFYVFYESQQQESFLDVLAKVFNEEKEHV